MGLLEFHLSQKLHSKRTNYYKAIMMAYGEKPGRKLTVAFVSRIWVICTASPDWPLANAESPVSIPYKRRESLTITAQCFVRKFRYEHNAIMHYKTFAVFKRVWNWTLSISQRPIWTNVRRAIQV